MAPMNVSSDQPGVDEQIAWNQAYDRLEIFLKTFALNDHSHVPRLALKLLDQARELHRQDASRDPTTLAMEQAQKHMAEWLAANIDARNQAPSQIFASGYIAVLLSRIYETAPASFLAPLQDDLRQSMRRTLLVTGPGLNISSMTPRHLDYGPMLHLARQTWHRWNSKAILIAMLFWTGVYFVFYWWLADLL